jgi:hypothetical protein
LAPCKFGIIISTSSGGGACNNLVEYGVSGGILVVRYPLVILGLKMSDSL